jgi:hypothetical protein
LDAAAVTAWVTGVGAVLSAIAGVFLIWRSFKSKQTREIDRLDSELYAWHRYAADLRVALADAGIDAPEPPWVEGFSPSPGSSPSPPSLSPSSPTPTSRWQPPRHQER